MLHLLLLTVADAQIICQPQLSAVPPGELNGDGVLLDPSGLLTLVPRKCKDNSGENLTSI